jgi:hypothetical protein
LDATSFIVGRPTLCTATTCLFIGPPGNSLLTTGPPDTCRREEYGPARRHGPFDTMVFGFSVKAGAAGVWGERRRNRVSGKIGGMGLLHGNRVVTQR